MPSALPAPQGGSDPCVACAMQEARASLLHPFSQLHLQKPCWSLLPHQVSYLASPHPLAWLITVLCTLQAAHSCLQTLSPARYQHFWMLYSLCVFTASSSLLTFLPCSTTPAGKEIEALPAMWSGNSAGGWCEGQHRCVWSKVLTKALQRDLYVGLCSPTHPFSAR